LNFLCTVLGWIEELVPLLISFAVAAFLWGLVKFIKNSDDERAHEEGKTFMIWGIIALFVMVSFWGIVGFIQDSVDLSPVGGFTPSVPVDLP
jgi:uncharacterized membrane protein YidH (DUF202 family)